MEHTCLDTPIGLLRVAVDHGALARVDFVDEPDASPGHSGSAGTAGVVGALGAYFAGDLDALDTITVEPPAGTPFQRRVWAALRAIPTGTTVSYAALAAEIGHPRAVRAVGTANGANPTGIVVPCHRVVRADGTLGGYAGGLDRKRWLLDHERRHSPRSAG